MEDTVAITQTAEATGTAKPAVSKGQLVVLKPPRLPYHEAVQERFGVDRAGWKALVEAIYPNAETVDAVIMALSYCRARNLDPFKRPVHIVPMWSSAAGKVVETVWPGISELRTTAFRTGQYAGMAEPEFGPTIERTFIGKAGRGKSKGQERSVTLSFPEWCRVTITRELNGKERKFVGPKVYWLESYAKWADTDVPNEMWMHRPAGQLEKCAEAGALRRAFPDEIGNDYAAEEMEGQRLIEDVAVVRERPKPETVTAPNPSAEPKPLPPLVGQAQVPLSTVSACSEQHSTPQEEDQQIPLARAADTVV
jgi:phage recombination protein Bet